VVTEAQNNTYSGRSDFAILFYVRAQFIRNKVILGPERTWVKIISSNLWGRQINDLGKQLANISSKIPVANGG